MTTTFIKVKNIIETLKDCISIMEKHGCFEQVKELEITLGVLIHHISGYNLTAINYETMKNIIEDYERGNK